jgi:hypothetical protein
MPTSIYIDTCKNSQATFEAWEARRGLRSRRPREAKRKAEAWRLKEDIAVCAAVEDLEKAVRESVAAIARIPKGEWGEIIVNEFSEDGEEITFPVATSVVFKRFTSKERRVLSGVTRKYPAAAKRLTASLATAWGLWEATLAEYQQNNLIGSSTKAGGRS